MRLSPGCATLGTAILLLAVSAPVAQAHAAYESSDPANGATVSSPPSRVTAKFTEPLVRGSKLEVYDPCGAQVDGRDSLVAGDQLTISMSADKQGAYTVRFSVVSAVDGHPTKGQFGFTSSGGAPCEQPEEPEKPSNDNSAGGSEGNAGGSGGTGSGGASGESAGGSSTSGASDGSSTAASNGRGGANPRDRNGRAASEETDDETPAERLAAPSAKVANAPGSAVVAAAQASAFEGVPKGAFVVGLLLAALTGAAGGKIYAGIMGWTSPPKKRGLRR